jgi:2-phosphoglycerate kinase
MLASMERAALRKQLKRRGREATERKASRYLDRLDDIWELQSYLLTEADNSGIPIITNWHIDTTIREILNLILAKVMKRYPPEESQPPWDD